MNGGGTDGGAPVVLRDETPAATGRDRALTFPVRLRCRSTSELLAAGGLEDAVGRALGRAFDRARKALPAADVVGGGVVLHPPQLTASGFAPDQEAVLLGRVTRAVEQAARAQSLPSRPVTPGVPASSVTGDRQLPRSGPAARPIQSESWRVPIQVDFRITPRAFFEIRALRRGQGDGSTDPADPLDLYFPILAEPTRATAWVAEVLVEREFTMLNREVLRRFSATRTPTGIIWSIHGWGGLRTLIAQADRDHRVAARIPDFGRRGFVEDRRAPATDERQTILRPGAWVLSVFLPLADFTLGDLVELGPIRTVDVPLQDLVALGIVGNLTAEAGIDLATAVREAPQTSVTVVVTPFTVRRRTHERTLAAVLGRYRRDTFNAQVGTVVPRTPPALTALGRTLGPFVGSLVPSSPGRERGPVAGFWSPGTPGANLTPLLASIGTQVLRAKSATFIATEVGAVQRILQAENSFWRGPERDDDLLAFIRRWDKLNNPQLFKLILDELHHRGVLDAFVSALRDLPSLYTYYKRVIVRLASGDARFSDVAGDIQRLARGSLDSHYDVAAQEVWLRRDQAMKVRAANGSSDDKVGVVAEVNSYYSESARILQPKPEVLDRLREPTRKKVSELIGRMICYPGERLTREQLLQRATQEAAKELPPLKEEDLIKVTLLKSVRILRIEERPERGVQEIYVHFQPVQKVGDNPWMPAGDVRVALPAEFEATLTVFHVKHLQSALTVFAMTQTVVLGGVMIIELGVATLGQLLFFVSMQVALYHFTTPADDRTLEGYLWAALRAELDAVGFKILAAPAKQLGTFAAGQLVTWELVSSVATKWIVFGLRGVVTATGAGGMEVTFQFGEDLLRYSHCQGWSSPGKYWDRFTTGFVMTLAFEFLAIPLLTPPIRLALEKASTAREAARALRATGKSLSEITGLLLKGAEQVESAIARTVEHGAGAEITRGFRQKVGDVLKALGREYESRAYQSLLELYGAELSRASADGLRRLLQVTGERQVDALLQRALAARRTLPQLLGTLGRMDEALLTDLVRTGNLPHVAALDEASLGLLQVLHRAKVKIGDLFDGSGPSLPTFGDELARLSPAQRATALENAAGRTPAQVLEQAQAPVTPPEVVSSVPAPATLDDFLRVLTAKGFTRDDLRAFMGTRRKVSPALARRVARLLEQYTAEEVRALGAFLSKHRVQLNDRTVAQLLEDVPRGRLRERIAELEEMRAGDDSQPQVWTEKELAEQEGMTIDSAERRPPRTEPDGKEAPLRDVGVTRGSRALRASLIARDGVLPPPGYHAHHVVPENDFAPGLDWLRDDLSHAGCGINDACNGVFLAGSRATANPDLTRLHNSYIHAGATREYAYTLTQRLYGKSGPALLEEVGKIAQEMAEGRFRILDIPHGWKTRWEPGMTAPVERGTAPEWIE